jgi:hypothetical protein
VASSCTFSPTAWCSRAARTGSSGRRAAPGRRSRRWWSGSGGRGAPRCSWVTSAGARPVGTGPISVSTFLSAFAAVPLRPNLELVGRLDRAFQAVPGSDSFDYFPFSEKARFVVGYAALDLLLAKHVHLIPNVEFAAYGRTTDGTRPGTDVMPRATVFYSW